MCPPELSGRSAAYFSGAARTADLDSAIPFSGCEAGRTAWGMKILISLFPAKPPCKGGSGNIPFDGEDSMQKFFRNAHEEGVAKSGVANFCRISSELRCRICNAPPLYSWVVKFKESVTRR